MADNALFNRDGWATETSTAHTADSDDQSRSGPADEPASPPFERHEPEAVTTPPVSAERKPTEDVSGHSVEDEGHNEPPEDVAPAQLDDGGRDRQVSSQRSVPTPASFESSADGNIETVEDSENRRDSAGLADVPDSASSASDSADPRLPQTLESDFNGETIGAVVGRWDPSRLERRQSTTDATSSDPANEPEHADQRSIDEANAVSYIAAAKDARRWLAPAAECEPAVQSIYAFLDQGTGHAHIRHGPAVDQEALARRVARLEDPAQQDDVLRDRSVDGLKPNQMHRCAGYATAIPDARVFAAVVAALSERTDVQDALNSDWDGQSPRPIPIPIADLLGPDGHEHCVGFQLRNDSPEARAQRKQWALARADGADLSELPEPEAEPIPTFEGGDIVVVFKRNHAASKFEINTIFPNPAEQ